MTAVIVQCRLASLRLREKALLPLGIDGLPLVLWTLKAMKKVKADAYWLACDTASYATLAPLAEKNGWNCFGGSETDVLKRFCDVIKKSGADTVVRATADNPFLFYEAARFSLDEFLKRNCDYFTLTGLPHGSGIEVLSARALLDAHASSSDPFEREHVGPALYNHKDRYRCIMEPSSSAWNYPALRTTVDTPADYRRALRIYRFLYTREGLPDGPFCASDILRALHAEQVREPVLAVPPLNEQRGRDYVHRFVGEMPETQNPAVYTDVYVGENPPADIQKLIDGTEVYKKLCGAILRELPESGEYASVLTCRSRLEQDDALKISAIAPLVFTDTDF